MLGEFAVELEVGENSAMRAVNMRQRGDDERVPGGRRNENNNNYTFACRRKQRALVHGLKVGVPFIATGGWWHSICLLRK